MIVHMSQEDFAGYNPIDAVDDFPVGTEFEIEPKGTVPFITLSQHEIDQCPDEIPEF